MNKQCARCDKTVYPLEELKCLDKVWHKTCFKCQVCNMALNMRNYKGFNKQPYCEAHIPKAKATTVVETPEFKRIQENTKLQSNAIYHAEFEKSKGKFTQVADDPETLRIKQNTKIISNVQYHGELEKKAMMEQKRTLSSSENGKVGSGSTSPEGSQRSVSPVKPSGSEASPSWDSPPPPPAGGSGGGSGGGSSGNSGGGSGATPYSARIGQSSTVIFTSDRGPVNVPPNRRVGSIADYDPLNDCYGSLVAEGPKGSPANQHYPASAARDAHHLPLQSHPPMQAPASRQLMGRAYRAMYDYEAQDSDEVSFLDGDVIVHCVPIDDGWMTGVVQRTGHTGMLPANYVELLN